jgi:hypothetical protein
MIGFVAFFEKFNKFRFCVTFLAYKCMFINICRTGQKVQQQNHTKKTKCFSFILNSSLFIEEKEEDDED